MSDNEEAEILMGLSTQAKELGTVTGPVTEPRKSGRKTERPARSRDWFLVDDGVAVFGPNKPDVPEPELPSKKKARKEGKPPRSQDDDVPEDEKTEDEAEKTGKRKKKRKRKANKLKLGNGLRLLPSVNVNGVDWRVGNTTWILWPDAEPQERICIGVGVIKKSPFAYFLRRTPRTGPGRSDGEVVCWPLHHLVFFFFFFFPCDRPVTETLT
jgi:hypothetical protein